MDAEDVGKELIAMLEAEARDQGLELQADLQAVADYAAQRTEHLRAGIGEDGYDRAVQAEAHNVALLAAGRTVEQADAADARLIGIAAGALRIGAMAIAAV